MIAIATRSLTAYRFRLIVASLTVAGTVLVIWGLTLHFAPGRPALWLIGAIVAAALASIYLGSRMARPVDRITGIARAMAAGDLRASVPVEKDGLEGLSSALADVRAEMRRRLAESEAEKRNLRAVLDGMTDAVLLLKDERIAFANSASGRLFRTPALGWRDRILGETDLPASVRAVASAAIDAGREAVEEIGPDPAGRTLRVSVLPLSPVEGHRRTLLVISDTTERTKLERMRRDFVANASHELKTPTTAIHLLAESAVDALQADDPAQALDFANRIEQESSRLSRLVMDLLDLSRLESTPAPGTVTDMRDAVSNAITGHRSAAGERGLDLTVDDEAVAGQDVYAKADPTDVAVALDNLLDNAINYTDGGSVTVRLDADAASVRLEVSDTGPGVAPEELPRIFERFYRVDRARARDTGGTGLGLALVRHVVERSSGSVDVTSEPGSGSTFTITLPRQR